MQFFLTESFLINRLDPMIKSPIEKIQSYKINKRKGAHHFGRAGMLLVLNMNNKCTTNSKKGVDYVYDKYCYNTNVLNLSMYWLDS